VLLRVCVLLCLPLNSTLFFPSLFFRDLYLPYFFSMSRAMLNSKEGCFSTLSRGAKKKKDASFVAAPRVLHSGTRQQAARDYMQRCKQPSLLPVLLERQTYSPFEKKRSSNRGFKKKKVDTTVWGQQKRGGRRKKGKMSIERCGVVKAKAGTIQPSQS
jgi:hypothetical protein